MHSNSAYCPSLHVLLTILIFNVAALYYLDLKKNSWSQAVKTKAKSRRSKQNGECLNSLLDGMLSRRFFKIYFQSNLMPWIWWSQEYYCIIVDRFNCAHLWQPSVASRNHSFYIGSYACNITISTVSSIMIAVHCSFKKLQYHFSIQPSEPHKAGTISTENAFAWTKLRQIFFRTKRNQSYLRSAQIFCQLWKQ